MTAMVFLLVAILLSESFAAILSSNTTNSTPYTTTTPKEIHRILLSKAAGNTYYDEIENEYQYEYEFDTLDLSAINIDILLEDWVNDDLWDNINNIRTINNEMILQKCIERDLCGCQSYDYYNTLNVYYCMSSSKYNEYNKYTDYYEYNYDHETDDDDKNGDAECQQKKQYLKVVNNRIFSRIGNGLGKKPIFNYGYQRNINQEFVKKQDLKKIQQEWAAFCKRHVVGNPKHTKSFKKSHTVSVDMDLDESKKWRKYKKSATYNGWPLTEAEHWILVKYTSHEAFCYEFRRYWRDDPEHPHETHFITDEEVERMAAVFYSAMHRPERIAELQDFTKEVKENGIVRGPMFLWHGTTAQISNVRSRQKPKWTWRREVQEGDSYKAAYTNRAKEPKKWERAIKVAFNYPPNKKPLIFHGPMSWTHSTSVAYANFAHGTGCLGDVFAIREGTFGAMLLDKKKLNDFGFLPNSVISQITDYPEEQEVILMDFDVNIIDTVPNKQST